MSDVLSKADALGELFEVSDVKEFVKLFKECEKTYAEPAAFLEAMAEWLPSQVYERYYGDDIPSAFLGVAAALPVTPLLAEDRKWWPAAQQAWHVARQRRRPPFRLPEAIPSGPIEERWKGFQKAAAEGDFEKAYGLARGFLTTEAEAKFLKRNILQEALRDGSRPGLKFLYLAQSWSLAEALEGRHAEKILFPALHYFVTGPAPEVVAQASTAGGGLAARHGVLGEEAQAALEASILFGNDQSAALAALDAAAAAGAGLEGAWEALRIAAFQAAANSKPGKWRTSTRVCLVTTLAQRTSADWQPEARLEALRRVATMLHEVSLESRELAQNRDLEEVARALVPIDTVNTLKSVVSHSDPIASATAAIALLSMDETKQRELCETLAALAAKNDGRMAGGYDLMAVESAVEAFRTFSSPCKNRPMVCCAFFLGRVPKSYELFGAYGVK